MRSTILLAFLALLAQAPQTPAPQAQPPVTFRSEVNYVEIDANVTDAQGNFVRTLSKDDFQLLEDGTPQKVTAFSMVNIPIEHADPPLFAKNPIVPDVASNARPFDGRVFILVLDDLQTGFTNTGRARDAARLFVERYVGANDLVAVLNTSGSTKSAEDFTSNKRAVIAALSHSIGVKEDSATAAKLQDYATNNIGGRGGSSTASADSNEVMRYTKARNSLRTLQNLADYLAGIRGRRKALVYFSEGINYDITDAIHNPHATDVQREMTELINRATRANVNIYGVDPRGLVTGMESAIEISSFPDDNSIQPTDLMDEMRNEQNNLRTVSDETGGFAVLNQNDFRNGFDKILQDNSSYYVLGYYPTNDKTDGKFRNVTVKVLQPGLKVRARRGYAAPSSANAKKAAKEAEVEGKAGKTSRELHEALDSPLPVSGLTLRAFAAPYRGASGKGGALDTIGMSIEIDGPSLAFKTTPDGLFHDDIEITALAIDDSGKVRDASSNTINLNLKPQTHAGLMSAGAFRVLQRVQVPPGKYELRIGAREANGGKVGTLVYHLDVPDFSKGPIAISGIAIASAYDSRVPTANSNTDDDAFKKALPSPPSAIREFPHGDTLAVSAEVYDNIGTKTPHRVEITGSILADDGHVVKSMSDERKSDELQGAGGGYSYGARIPLADVPPGRYVLRVSAKATVGNSDAVTRDVEFTVR